LVDRKENAMNLVERVKRLLLSPRTEWGVIDAESTTPAALYTGYVLPLAAIGPIAQVIGYSVFGISVPFLGTYRVPIGSAITNAILTYVLALIATYLLGLIIDGLAPTFGAQRSPIQALKVAVYSSTPAWLAGVFALVPGLRPLQILGLYSLYLLYLGLPMLMKAPRDKAPGYTVVVILASIVLFMVIGFTAGRFLAVPTAGMTLP
jgi:Yip1-like protein